MLKIKACAKINLGLDVLKRLPNGYHEVKMVMQTVDIYDELLFEKSDAGIQIFTDCGELPTDEDNLVYKAAQLFLNKYSIKDGVKITLKKNIPIAAGMAGGSTDAAATLNGLNCLFEIREKENRLREIGVKIGADVPYCISGGTVLAEGIGEKLTALPRIPQGVLLVAKPDIHVSTKYVYEHLDALEEYEHPDIDGMVDSIRKQDMQGVILKLGNVLENVTAARWPIVTDIQNIMKENGAKGSLMSGSGPTVFGFFETKDQAAKAGEMIREKGMSDQIFVTGFTERSWRILDE